MTHKNVVDAIYRTGAVNYLAKNSTVEKILKTIRDSLELGIIFTIWGHTPADKPPN